MCSVSTCVNRVNLAQSKPSFWLISPSGTCCNVHLELGKVGGGRGKGEGGRRKGEGGLERLWKERNKYDHKTHEGNNTSCSYL